MGKPRALIFCPVIGGHRQTYSSVVSQWFLDSGFEVFLAAGRSAEGIPAAETPLISILAKRSNIVIVDLEDITKTGLISGSWVRILGDMEKELAPDWTFFPAGNELIIPLEGLGRGIEEKRPRRAAIIIGCTQFYPKRLTGKNIIRLIRDWQTWHRLKTEEMRYFRKRVWESLGLDIAFSTNDDFLRILRDSRFRYLPEIYRDWGFDISEQADRSWSHKIDRLCVEYASFLSRHPGKEIILYYGGWTPRRGYDRLMYISVNDPKTLFVSCGRPIINDRFKYDVDTMRDTLKRQDRIFEIEIPFLPGNRLTDHIFRSCSYVMLPHDNWYSTSGSLVQAASYGKPVLVPDVGYSGSVVRRFGIGITYRNNDEVDFLKKRALLRRTTGLYAHKAMEFSRLFDIEKIRDSLKDLFICDKKN